MPVNVGLAQLSDHFLLATVFFYAFAVLAYAGDFAFGRRGAGRTASQAQAAQQADPAAARKLWAKLDRLVTNQAPWVPILNASDTVFVSARVGNYQESPSYGGPLLDQIWIR